MRKHIIHTAAALVLTLAILLTPARIAFGLELLSEPWLYLVVLGLILVPLAIMECSKAFGLIKHETKR